MIDDLIGEYGELFAGGNVSFFYSGYISQPLLTAMVEGFKVKLDLEGLTGTTRRRLLSSLVEMTQNVIHYAMDSLTPSDQNDHQLRWGSICVILTGGHYQIECANRVSASQRDNIKAKLEKLRLMTHAEIKEYYAKVIREEAPADSKGAGLGLITIARDAQGPIEYRMIDDPERPDTAIFVIKATI
ncbi:SiaB family protein kinase [Burkholderiaceae bacterium DAT-1]|nr:SiaB family protein kinase [Burkholderiaceae bacterium DAT-1]